MRAEDLAVVAVPVELAGTRPVHEVRLKASAGRGGPPGRAARQRQVHPARPETGTLQLLSDRLP
ncbi:hypothetical protein ACWC9T_22935 [Kitasatospora sp. NPDC001159]